MKHRTILVVILCLVIASVSPATGTHRETSGASAQQSFSDAKRCFQNVTFRTMNFPAYRQNAHSLDVEGAMSGNIGDGPRTNDTALSVQVERIHAESVCLEVKPTGDDAGIRMTFHDAVLKKTKLQGANMRFERATADAITFDVPKRIGRQFRSLLTGGDRANDGNDDAGAGPNSGANENRTVAPGDTTHRVGTIVNDSTEGRGEDNNPENEVNDTKNKVGNGVDNVTDGVNDTRDDVADRVHDTTGNVTDGVDDTTNDTTDKITDGADNTTDTIGDTTDNVTDRLTTRRKKS